MKDSESAINFWLERQAGRYGCAIRQALIHPVVHEAITQLYHHKNANNNGDDLYDVYCRKPYDVVWAGLKARRKDLSDPTNQLENNKHSFCVENTKIGKWNENPTRSIEEGKTFTVLDIGCGEGSLGRFLASTGVEYLGIEPNESLYQECKNKSQFGELQNRPKYLNAELIQDKNATKGLALKIKAELKLTDSAEHTIPPDLIVANSVLDHFEDPSVFLKSLNSLIRQLAGDKPTPVLLTSLDPAFFATDPVQHDSSTLQCQVQVPEDEPYTFQAYPPHGLEQIFRECGYHVLQLARLSSMLLPFYLQDYLKQIHVLDVGTDGGQPRYAPIMFWLVSPRCEEVKTVDRNVTTLRGMDGLDANLEEVTLRTGEVLEVTANLGQYVYFVEAGELSLVAHNKESKYKESLKFGQGEWLGELEALGDPLISRFLGSVVAKADGTKVLRIPISRFNDLLSLPPKTDLAGDETNHFLASLFSQFRLKALEAFMISVDPGEKNHHVKWKDIEIKDVGPSRLREIAKYYMIDRCSSVRSEILPTSACYGVPSILLRSTVRSGPTRPIEDYKRTAISFLTEIGICDGFHLFEDDAGGMLSFENQSPSELSRQISKYYDHTTAGLSHDGFAIITEPRSLFGLLTSDPDISSIKNLVTSSWLIHYYVFGNKYLQSQEIENLINSEPQDLIGKSNKRAAKGNIAGSLALSWSVELRRKIGSSTDVEFYLKEYEKKQNKSAISNLISNRRKYFLQSSSKILGFIFID